MRRLSTRYLDDGKGFNQGQPTPVIEIEATGDFDEILRHIGESDFYGNAYLERQSGLADDRLAAHFWWVAAAAASFAPRRALEIGCGRGDVLRLLHEVHGVDVTGIDMGSGAFDRVWPSVRPGFHAGDISDVLRDWPPGSFDLVCGFDIWEHLHPSALDDVADLVVRAGTDDAWFLFVVPAFGDDPVFGEAFPLELEENRDAYERRVPFRFLIADAADPAVPAAGHLTWAHTDWWVALFARHGLERVPEVERRLHGMIDPLVPRSVQAFYVLRRKGSAAPVPATGRSRGITVVRSLLRRWWYVRSTDVAFSISTLEELDRVTASGMLHRRVGNAFLAVASVVGRAARVVQRR